MTTALTVFYSNAASSTLSTANQLYSASGTPTTVQTLTELDASTGYGEICSQGSATAWAALGAIGNPTGKGFLWDVTTLEGNSFVAGNWSAAIRLNSQQGQAFQGAIFVRAWKRSSGGVYTLIVSMSLTGQSFTGSITTYSLPSTSASSVSFTTGDKLYVDAWLNVTANQGTSGQQIRLNRLSTDTTTHTGDANAEVVTPGYAATVAATGAGYVIGDTMLAGCFPGNGGML